MIALQYVTQLDFQMYNDKLLLHTNTTTFTLIICNKLLRTKLFWKFELFQQNLHLLSVSS